MTSGVASKTVMAVQINGIVSRDTSAVMYPKRRRMRSKPVATSSKTTGM